MRLLTPIVLTMLFLTAGCQHVLNPFANVPPCDTTTPSEQAILAAGKESTDSSRGWAPVVIAPADGQVTHWPLWWEDPFEDKGSDDNRLAWTWEDYFAWPYGFGRFLVNTMFWPASAVVTPPGTVMASDGVLSRQILGYDHDATRYAPTVPLAEPLPPEPQVEPGDPEPPAAVAPTTRPAEATD